MGGNLSSRKGCLMRKKATTQELEFRKLVKKFARETSKLMSTTCDVLLSMRRAAESIKAVESTYRSLEALDRNHPEVLEEKPDGKEADFMDAFMHELMYGAGFKRLVRRIRNDTPIIGDGLLAIINLKKAISENPMLNSMMDPEELKRVDELLKYQLARFESLIGISGNRSTGTSSAPATARN